MADQIPRILETAGAGFASQDAELAAVQARQMFVVITKTASGSGPMNATFSLDQRFRLVFVRCHFVGGGGTSPLTISVASAGGSSYDTRLFSFTQAGTGQDVHFRITAEELTEPSPWVFQAGDEVRVAWTNPDSGNMSWGLEVGLALAS